MVLVHPHQIYRFRQFHLLKHHQAEILQAPAQRNALEQIEKVPATTKVCLLQQDNYEWFKGNILLSNQTKNGN